MLLEHICVGAQVKIRRRVTRDLVQKFAECSADFNPLHLEADFAKAAGFNGPVAHGMLIAAFTSEIVGMHLPGSDGIYVSHQIFFKEPVYDDDELTFIAEVTHKSQSTRIIKLEFTVWNQCERIVANGRLQARVNSAGNGNGRK